MIRCNQPGCRWEAIAPSQQAAKEQFRRHLVDEHLEEVDADVPEGMVQVKTGEDEWTTMKPEEARAYHESAHNSSELD